MNHDLKLRSRSVEARGAAAGCVVRGAGRNNQGVRIRVLGEQPRGNRGGIRGAFVLLDAGDNKHTEALRPLLGRPTNAEEVLRVIRRDSPGCVSVANANSLAHEQSPPEGGAAMSERHDDEADKPPPENAGHRREPALTGRQ